MERNSMEKKELFDLKETVNLLQEKNRSLRAALETTECGRALLLQGEEFSRLLSVSKLIVSELDLTKVFNLVASNAREIVNAELVVVPILNEERDQYTYVAASGADADIVLGKKLSANVGMCGWVLQHKRSLLFGEISTHWIGEKTPWEAGQQSAVLVPLIGRKGIIGGLSALGKQGGGCFTGHDLDLLTMFANQVSIAIENAQLFQQVTLEIEERNEEITERKKAEEELLRHKEHLEELVDERIAEIKTLQGILPICSSCKKIRDDMGAWHQLEAYIRDHTEAEFSHGICAECAKKLYPDFFDKTP